MSRSAHPTATSSDSVADIHAARQADYVAFLHWAPFAIDAANMGYLTGYREDCTYQHTQYETLELGVGMLDNDFRNPDLERYINRFREYEPRVGVLGDAYSIDELVVLPVTETVVRRAIAIQHDLLDRGQHIGARDVLIAETAVDSPDPRVLTRNVDEFARVDDLDANGY